MCGSQRVLARDNVIPRSRQASARSHQRASSRGPQHASGLFACWGGSRDEEWYRPGGSLTDQTGRIPDTANEGRRELERAHAMEIEQCYGRETTVYFRV